MSYARLRSELLAARDRRHTLLVRTAGKWRATLFLSLVLPGADKSPPGASALFAWALREATTACSGLAGLHAGEDRLGPFALLGGGVEPAALKRLAVALEAAAPFARLVDADVYDRRGVAVDRKALGLPPRRCLLCEAPAKECIRLGRHGAAELSRRVHELLAPFTG